MKISRKSKVLNITHCDMDGCGCSILLGAIYEDLTVIQASYNNIDTYLYNTDESEYDYIFVTDIYPVVSEVLDKFTNLILIDHHQSAVNNLEKRHYVNKKYCATYLTHHFLTKMYGDKQMSKFTKFVNLVNDYDMWILKSKGKLLNDLYGYYNFDSFLKRFYDGDITLKDNEKKYLKNVQLKFDDMYENLEIVEFEKINACFFMCDVFVNELSHKLQTHDGYNIVFYNTTKNYKISMRSNINDFNVGLYLKDNNLGGGHVHAGGINTSTEQDMNNAIDFIENDLYNKLPLIRKAGVDERI
jgi:oligoribonuclease NrnB/cAMP/cGMP phosphodiesterase (DHH superfamily)